MTGAATAGQSATSSGSSTISPGFTTSSFPFRERVSFCMVLLYSEAFSPALYNPLKGYIPFPAVITVVEPCAGGVYIVADKTYFLTGAMAEASLREVSRATGVPGTGLALDDGTVCWVSDSGLVVGTPSGEVNNVQDKHVAVAPAAAGATLYREQDGMRQLVASLFNPGTSVAAATTYMDAEIVRQGETL